MADGIFQSALASFLLFSPERQADPMGAALAFALVLVPYSVVGPFVGTILDRFSRQRILLISNLIRTVTLSCIALLIFKGHTGSNCQCCSSWLSHRSLLCIAFEAGRNWSAAS